jgi:hypothetical protein
MSVNSRWMFIFVGNDATGKTTIQRVIVELLHGRAYNHLPSNTSHDLTHPYFPRKCRRFFVAGRSYQELLGKGDDKYTSVEEYFEKRVDAAPPPIDLAFIASHLDETVITEMIRQAHRRFWNVCGIFLTNSLAADPQPNAVISRAHWDERWVAENPPSDSTETQNRQLRRVAEMIVQMIIERTRGW